MFCMAGCSGEFILTAPDTVGQAGQDVPVAVRLQRREFWEYVPPTDGAALCFCMPDGAFKAARTDKHGYASVVFPVPDKPGRYDVDISHQDIRGDTCQGSAWMYVLEGGKPIAVIDLDGLPDAPAEATSAAAAIQALAPRVDIIYTTDKFASKPTAAHEFLARLQYPDSAVVPAFTKKDWLRKYDSPSLPNMIVVLKNRLSDLRYGITHNATTANAMQQAGLELIYVGKSGPSGVFHVPDYAHLDLPPARQPSGPAGPVSSRPAE